MNTATQDKVAIVTGASRGIGAAVARGLAADGYAIVVNYQANGDAAAQVVNEIEGAGGRALAVQADIVDESQVMGLFEEVDRELGTLSVLVNNAGLSGPACRVDELSTDDLNRIVGTNVLGLIMCSKQAVRRMSSAWGGGGGSIVNISSGAAHMGLPGRGVHYAMSKGAVDSFSIGLSQEVAGEGIRVNTVSPGPTATDMMPPGSREAAAEALPMGRVGEPDEIANAVRWLVSDAASFVAGATIRAAGGRP